MKKIIIFFSFFILSFILISCSKTAPLNKSQNSYFINEKYNSLDITWNFGIINFENSLESKIEESFEQNSQSKLDYYIKDSILYINSNSNKNKDLTIYIDKDKIYDTIKINGIYIDTTIQNMKIKNLNIDSNTGFYFIEDSNIDEFNSSMISDVRHYQSHIKRSKINNCNIYYERIHQFYITNSQFESLNAKFGYTEAFLQKNEFSSLSIEQTSGDTHIDLDGTKGYTFKIDCKTVSLDMETIHYNNYYFYKDGKYKVNLSNTKGSFDIRRYFS